MPATPPEPLASKLWSRSSGRRRLVFSASSRSLARGRSQSRTAVRAARGRAVPASVEQGPGDALTVACRVGRPVLVLLKQVEQVRDGGPGTRKAPGPMAGCGGPCRTPLWRLVDQAVEFTGVLAGHLVGHFGRQVAELVFDVLL